MALMLACGALTFLQREHLKDGRLAVLVATSAADLLLTDAKVAELTTASDQIDLAIARCPEAMQGLDQPLTDSCSLFG